MLDLHSLRFKPKAPDYCNLPTGVSCPAAEACVLHLQRTQGRINTEPENLVGPCPETLGVRSLRVALQKANAVRRSREKMLKRSCQPSSESSEDQGKYHLLPESASSSLSPAAHVWVFRVLCSKHAKTGAQSTHRCLLGHDGTQVMALVSWAVTAVQNRSNPCFCLGPAASLQGLLLRGPWRPALEGMDRQPLQSVMCSTLWIHREHRSARRA